MKHSPSGSNEKTVQEAIGIGRLIESLGIEDVTIIGDSNRGFTDAVPFDLNGENSLTYCRVSKIQNIGNRIRESKASIVITEPGIDISDHDLQMKTFVLTGDPRFLYAKIVAAIHPYREQYGVIADSAIIGPLAVVHEQASIGPHCVVGSSSIGERSILHANVVVGDGCNLGRQVIVNPGSVIGYDGFGFVRNPDGTLMKFPHRGGVIIKNDVEIGTLTSIGKGIYEDTVIWSGVKIGDLCRIAHNVTIDENTRIVSKVMIGGSARIGRNCFLGMGALIRNGACIGDDAVIGMGAVVTKDVKEGETVMGNPARPEDEGKRRSRLL